jgi:hypothetical protein
MTTGRTKKRRRRRMSAMQQPQQQKAEEEEGEAVMLPRPLRLLRVVAAPW